MDQDTFDYRTYWRILEKLSATHQLLRFADVKDGVPPDPFVLLRHDVDYSVAAALEMAEQEAARGVRATYLLLLNGLYYNLFEPRYAHLPARLVELGHEVGLHYDVNFLYEFADARWRDLIRLQADVLAQLSGRPVLSIAMHQPGLNGSDPLRNAGDFLNAYDDRFFRDIAYMSDSARAWRDTTWRLLSEGPLPRQMQIVFHPINWASANRSRHEIFTGVHVSLAEDVMQAGRVLLDQVGRHAGVAEHEARLDRSKGAGQLP